MFINGLVCFLKRISLGLFLFVAQIVHSTFGRMADQLLGVHLAAAADSSCHKIRTRSKDSSLFWAVKCHQLFQAVNIKAMPWTEVSHYQKLFEAVASFFKLFQAVYTVNSFFKLSTSVSSCRQLFQAVNSFFKLSIAFSTAVSICRQLVQAVNSCLELLTNCFNLSIVLSSCQCLPTVFSRWQQLLRAVNSCKEFF